MSAFIDACKPYLDQDGMIGSCPNPTKWTTGNPHLESAIACAIELQLNGLNYDKPFVNGIVSSIEKCKNPDGSFDKNPGRTDQITHDDLKADAALTRLCDAPMGKDIYDFGNAHNWVLSNTGFPYWDASVKPWDKAFYTLCVLTSPAWYETICLCLSIIFDSFWGDPSSNRLSWLMLLALEGLNPFVDLSFVIWRKMMRKKYTTVGGLMFSYYGASGINHPYVVYGRVLSF